jgi:nicotinamidase/pyrazinamidase
VSRLAVGGLATEYCVLRTVCDALARGYQVRLLRDAVRAVDVSQGMASAPSKRCFDVGR